MAFEKCLPKVLSWVIVKFAWVTVVFKKSFGCAALTPPASPYQQDPGQAAKEKILPAPSVPAVAVAHVVSEYDSLPWGGHGTM